jgi:hypothetical protein
LADVKVHDIEIIERPDLQALNNHGPVAWVSIDGVALSIDEREQLARSDGFESFAEMMQFWKGRLPFHGDIIHWDPEDPR